MLLVPYLDVSWCLLCHHPLLSQSRPDIQTLRRLRQSYLPIITLSSLRVFILITLHFWAFSFSAILPVLSTSRLVLFRMCSYFDETTILDRIKREQLNPFPSPQSNDKGAKEQQTRHFGIIEMGGGEWWFRCSISFVQDYRTILSEKSRSSTIPVKFHLQTVH